VRDKHSKAISRRRALAGIAAAACYFAGPPKATPRTSCTEVNRIGARSERLEILGNELYSGGRKLRLLGVAVGDPIYIRSNRAPDDYRVISEEWNANVVRISLHPGHWRADKRSALRQLEDEVNAARAVGLGVIVDWHAIGFPDHFFERPNPEWGLPADIYFSDASLAEDFWETIARAFGQDPGVLFELWNEPVVDATNWRASGKDWPLLRPLWSRLLAAVRRHSDAIVLVSGGCWAHDLKGVVHHPMDDSRVAYAWHCYPPWDGGDPQGWIASLGDVPAQWPVVVTEWGFCRDCPDYIRGTATSFGRPFVDHVLEPLKLHSTAWCWAPGVDPPMLRADGVTPTNYGAFVKRYLATATCAAANLPRSAGESGKKHVN